MNVTVAIVGRPNVGKSTLFNRLVGKRLALVAEEPGVTRDRREGAARLFDLEFTAVDTAGLEEAEADSLEARMRAQTDRAVAAADLALLLIDARAGITPLDRHFADWLRRGPTPVVLVANKCESRAGEAGRLEAFALGLGEPVPLSAEHNLGLSDLRDAIQDVLEGRALERDAQAPEQDAAEEEGERTLQLAIVGRPNVGKSTLVNRLVGEERVLTGPEAGITRDAIAIEWSYKGRPIRLIDTAGLRRRAKAVAKVEKLSAGDALRAIDFAQVVVLLVDAAAPMEKQDLTIARQVLDEGRALVIAVNKWDACTDRAAAMKGLGERLERSLPQSRGLPVVTVSALRGQNLDRLLDAVFAAYDVWNRRVATSALNSWLAGMVQRHPPPAPGGRRVRLRYATQAKIRPPSFVIFCSRPQAVPDAYLRYLENGLRSDFDLPGTPIRITLRKGKNPYADKK
ncbi:MAG: ribosome biogenesis GTPase Der [Proteobacteria bacterium]|nr:ribosome biogenesis GTPase Der [Pseudomonadota bacterium]